jgi:hypothetical protein
VPLHLPLLQPEQGRHSGQCRHRRRFGWSAAGYDEGLEFALDPKTRQRSIGTASPPLPADVFPPALKVPEITWPLPLRVSCRLVPSSLSEGAAGAGGKGPAKPIGRKSTAGIR